MSYKIKKPITNIERADFVFEYNRYKGLRIAETDEYLYALEENEMMGVKKVKGVEVQCPVINPNFEEEKAKEEQEYINSIPIPRLEFFNATILAFGLSEEELIEVLGKLATSIKMEDVQRKLLINSLKNESEFYRRYSLFTLLTNNPIPISKKENITVSREQWDEFFKRVDRCDKEAYKELLPKEGA